MATRNLFWLVLFVMAYCVCAQAQYTNNQRVISIRVEQKEILLDSMLVLPATVGVYEVPSGVRVGSDWYEVRGSRFRWVHLPASDSVLISFRVLADWDGSSAGDTITLVKKGFLMGSALPESVPKTDNRQTEGMQYSGTFSRGVSFGNSQNLVLNSVLNLQIDGELGDGVLVRGAITDNNIPFQPEGNTQRLQEFDRIFIQFSKGEHALTVGDFDSKSKGGYFVKYLQKLQGISYSGGGVLGNSWRLNTDVSAAVSRGLFKRQTWTGEEGNQGPYKLTGLAGETFLVVLSGSESVFVDGIPMKRGFDGDYTIDYNTGEVRFTANRLITKDKRIVVEFLYMSQGYIRSFVAANGRVSNGKNSIYVHSLSEQDGKNQAARQVLSPTQVAQLTELGDAAASSYFSGVDTTMYNADIIQYRLVDTLYEGVLYDSVLVVVRSNEGQQLYKARFTEVGYGNGNYVLDPSESANGRVYKWIAPTSNGTMQGNYEPVIRLIPPTQKQQIALGAEGILGSNTLWRIESSVSRVTPNTFSPKDRDNDVGFGLKAGFTLPKWTGKRGSLAWANNYEYVSPYFKPFQPYRPVEFLRNWNLDATPPTAHEHLLNSLVQYESKQGNLIQYQATALVRDSLYKGIQQQANIQYRWNRVLLSSTPSLLLTSSPTRYTSFLKPYAKLSYTFDRPKKWTMAVAYQQERNTQKTDTSAATYATLLPSSFQFRTLRYEIATVPNDSFKITASAEQRTDYTVANNTFAMQSQAYDYHIDGLWASSPNNTLLWNVNYRTLHIADSSTHTYLAHVEYLGTWWRGGITCNTLYELNTGQEPKTEFTYLQVPAGQGNYTWIDRNMDNIKQLDEFEISPFPDQAQYIRLLGFSNQYVRSNGTLFQTTLDLNPRRFFTQSSKGFARLLTPLYWQSTIKINKKTFPSASIQVWNPFQTNLPDTAFVALQTSLRNTLYFNRSNPKYGIDLSQNTYHTRSLLINGFDARSTTDYTLKARYNINSKWSLLQSLTIANKKYASQAFSFKNYTIREYRTEPQLTYQYLQYLRLTTRYRYKYAYNIIGNLETTQLHDFTTEVTLHRNTQTDLRTRASIVQIRYNGASGTPTEFILLEGLQKGTNYLWGIQLEHNLSSSVRLSIGYDGRRTAQSIRTYHIGRVNLQANF